MNKRNIPFSPPDINQKDIDGVVEVLKSGWITTGKKTQSFEQKLAEYSQTKKALALNSATIGLYLALKYFGVKEGDEVITTPFTYAATANTILHTGAKPVFADINKDDFNISVNNIEKLITNKTKAIISVDYGGMPVDYDEINALIKSKRNLFKPSDNTIQQKLRRILFVSDAAHALGSVYKGVKVGSQADFTVFSFHAVKNLTTAEGGAVLFGDLDSIDSEEICKELKLLALHGQNKDALAKYHGNSWEYDIILPGYKANMTDIQASLGLSQLERYSDMLKIRSEIMDRYKDNLLNTGLFGFINDDRDQKVTSKHLVSLSINNINEDKRNLVISRLMERGIGVNVHFKPLPLMTLYKNLGYDISNYKESYDRYKNLVTLPIYSKLSLDDVDYICDNLVDIVKNI